MSAYASFVTQMQFAAFSHKMHSEKLVHALISPKLDYVNAVFAGCHNRKIKQLQLIQNMITRVDTGARKFDQITPILRALHRLPVETHIIFKIIILAFRTIHGTGLSYLSDLISIYYPRRELRS